MKALIYDRFGGAETLHLADSPEPPLAAGQIMVAIEARSINLIDIKIRDGKLGPLVNKRFPKIPGADFAGTVVGVASDVRAFKVGDTVLGAADPFKGGSFAERICVPASQVALRPGAMSPVQAAALPIAGLAALLSLRDLGKVRPGQKVLIHGATGPVGLYAVQIARMMKAKVTAVGGAGLLQARRLGADRTIDYRDGSSVAAGERFDLIVNASGKFPYEVGRDFLGPSGRLIEPSPTIPIFIGSKIANLFRKRKHLVLATQPKTADLAYLVSCVESGTLEVTVAASYSLSDFRAAFARVESGGVAGKVVVTT